MKKYIIHSDGGARGNPGPAAIGAVIKDEQGLEIQYISQKIGETTNNQAEYKAIISALEKALEMGVEYAECFLDSELVVQQLNHKYKVKNKDLAPLFLKVHNLSLQFKKISFHHVMREKNKEADRLVNEALDG